MHFPWTTPPREEILPTELLSESEIKERFESISKFMLEYQKQYFDGLKFSLNMWMLINSGSAIALLNKGTQQSTYIAICLMLGALFTGAGSIHLNNSVHKIIENLFDHAMTKNISLCEFYINMKLSLFSLRKSILFALCIPYFFFSISIILICMSTEI